MHMMKYYVAGSDHDPVLWRNWSLLNDRLVFSYRDVDYTSHNYPSALHFHDYYELLIIVEGDIQYVHENDIYCPCKGDIVLIPPHHLHCSRPNSEKTKYKRYVLYFHPDCLHVLGADVLLDFIAGLSPRTFYYATSYSMTGIFLKLAAKIHTALEKDTVFDEQLAKSYLLQLFYQLSALNWSMPNSSDSFPAILQQILEYLDVHFTEPLSLTELADHFFYSREHISKLFAKYMNTTYTDYIMNKRISLSQQLMRTAIPLTEVCFKAGFGSLSAFNRAFNKFVGMPPSQFRKEYRDAAID